MRSAPRVPAAAGHGSCSADGLAGSLRTEINRLAYHLRRPATKSGITPPPALLPSRPLPVTTRGAARVT
jgi:hypothetical protein